MLEITKLCNINFLQRHNFNSERFPTTTDQTQITINDSVNTQTLEDFVEIFNTKITKN